MPAFHLTERVWLVGSGQNGFDLTDRYDCHVYLLDGGSELALVDAGAGLGHDAIRQHIVAAGFAPDRVGHILLTHAHGDHAGGTARWRRETGARVYLSRARADALRTGDEDAVSLTAARRRGFYPPDYRLEPCPVDVELADGDRFRVGDLEVLAIDTPGHCDGLMSFLVQAAGRAHLFCGDTVFWGGRILLLNTPDCSIPNYARSLERLARLQVDCLLPGHGMLSLRDGQRHIQQAHQHFVNLLVPQSIL